MLCPLQKEREKWLKSFESAFIELEGREGGPSDVTEEEEGVFSISGNTEMAQNQIRSLNMRHRIENFSKNFGNSFSEKCLGEGQSLPFQVSFSSDTFSL
jgi:hypothetical protein